MFIDLDILEDCLTKQLKLCREQDELRAQRDRIRNRLTAISEEMDGLGSSILDVLNQAREELKD